jgi:NADPH:quinone reductase-like Zn-dependent oxidoreductase
VLGSDVAGEVVALGAGVTGASVGQLVHGDMSTSGFGAFAELVVAPESTFAPIPSSVTMQQAGVLPQAGGLAITALRGRPRPAGARVLVNGAGGGVGTFAVQLAKAEGAHVTAVDAAHKLDVLTALGADRVVDYVRDDIAHDGGTFDLIVDIVATRSIRDYRRMLAPGGRCGLIGGDVGRIVRLMATGTVISVIGGKKITVPIWRPNDADDVTALTRAVEAGSVVPVIDRVVALEDVPDAFAEFAAQRHRGKIAISV